MSIGLYGTLKVPSTANPVGAIIAAVIISLLMVGLTFIMFVKSTAYETVRQLHSESLVKPVDLGTGVDTTSPVKGNDIDAFGQKIEQRARIFNDKAEFDTEGLSDKALGI